MNLNQCRSHKFSCTRLLRSVRRGKLCMCADVSMFGLSSRARRNCLEQRSTREANRQRRDSSATLSLLHTADRTTVIQLKTTLRLHAKLTGRIRRSLDIKTRFDALATTDAGKCEERASSTRGQYFAKQRTQSRHWLPSEQTLATTRITFCHARPFSTSGRRN